MEMIFYIVGGLIFLYLGAEGLVRGSSALALRLRISPLVVGLTVVAFGTSAPELVVSLKASLMGTGDIALGNVIGSNICNIGLILGLSALVRPLRIQIQTVRLEVPILIGSSFLIWIFLRDMRLGRLEGMVLTTGVLAFIFFNVWHARKQQDTVKTSDVAGGILSTRSRIWVEFVLLFAGIGLLIFGAGLFVDGSVEAARRLGVGEAFIGLTLVALGTSLPELATSVVAAWKGQNDISVGNVIGSNIFNTFGILGISSTVQPIQGVGIQTTDLIFMTGLSLLILPLMKTDFTLKRWEGGILLFIYIGYIFHLLP
jgi:cation:H+ antiporter